MRDPIVSCAGGELLDRRVFQSIRWRVYLGGVESAMNFVGGGGLVGVVLFASPWCPFPDSAVAVVSSKGETGKNEVRSACDSSWEGSRRVFFAFGV